MTYAVAVTDLNAKLFVPFWEENVLPGGWKKQPAPEVVFGPVEQIVVTYSGSNVSVLGDVYGSVTYTSWSNGSTVDISGYVWDDVNLEPLADWNSFSSAGVFGGIYLDDAWETTLEVGFVFGGISVNDVRGGDYDIGWTPTYQVEDSSGIEAELDTVYNVTFDDVNESQTDIGTLFGYMSISGDGNEVSIANATGATIQITSGSAETMLQIERGGTVFDNGNSTSFVGGEGDQFVFANGDGVSMYDGGGYGLLGEILGLRDHDTFVDHGGGIDIIAGFESASFDTNGDVFVFDPQNLEEATLQLGQHDVDIDALMAVFGQQDGNDAVLDFNGGSLTLVGAADEYFDMAAHAEDYAFAA